MHSFIMKVFLILALFTSSSNQVDRELTPIGRPELAAVLRDGHHAVFGYFPSDRRLAVAWAQVAIENRQGLEVYNHNLGNINSTKSRPYYVKRNRFRSHPNFNEGAEDYWRVILRMCHRSLPYFDSGQPYQAAQVLSACGYYGADRHLYGRAMQQLYRQARSSVIPQLK